jgi:hypothetical protein
MYNRMEKSYNEYIINLNKDKDLMFWYTNDNRVAVNQNWVNVPLVEPTPPVKPVKPAHKDTHTDLHHEQCSICMDNKKCVFFASCGHVVSCWSCSADLRDCPQCKKAIAGKLMAFI